MGQNLDDIAALNVVTSIMIPLKDSFIVLDVEYVDKEAEIILNIALHVMHVFLRKALTIINARKRHFAKNAQYASKTNLAQLSLQSSFNVVTLCIDNVLWIFLNTSTSALYASKAFVIWLFKKGILIWK